MRRRIKTEKRIILGVILFVVILIIVRLVTAM